MSLPPVIRMDNVSRHYSLGKTDVAAVKNVDLDIQNGEFLVLAGPSGSGKTTLLNMMGLIDKPTSGRVWLDGEDTTPRSLNHLTAYRRDKIGYIFQTFNLIPVLSVYENIEFPLILSGVSRDERRKRVDDAMGKVGLQSRKKHRPRELSGGECQRVSIARAIVKNPGLIIADEPTANLDSATGLKILGLIQRLHEDDGITFIFSSHDPRIIDKGKRIVRLRDGAIEGVEEK
jgi:putative ABC transport system ATP-binding protein